MKLRPFDEANRFPSQCPKCGEFTEREPMYNAPSQFSEFGPDVDCLGYPCVRCGHAFYTRCADAPRDDEVSA